MIRVTPEKQCRNLFPCPTSRLICCWDTLYTQEFVFLQYQMRTYLFLFSWFFFLVGFFFVVLSSILNKSSNSLNFWERARGGLESDSTMQIWLKGTCLIDSSDFDIQIRNTTCCWLGCKKVPMYEMKQFSQPQIFQDFPQYFSLTNRT